LGALRERGRVVDGRIDSPRIGNDVAIGAGARVLGPITIGDRCVIGANAVVVRNAAPDSVLVGIPAHRT
jgi:serine O-acetyltransferase